jgi:site-specific recombinase XerC
MQITDAVRHYLNAQQTKGKSRLTTINAKSSLKRLCAVLDGIGVTTVGALNHDALMAYREELAWHVTAKGSLLSERSQSECLGHLRAFCRFLVCEGWLLANPSAHESECRMGRGAQVRPACGHQKAGLNALLSPYLCHAHAQKRRANPAFAGNAGPCLARDDARIYARHHQRFKGCTRAIPSA